VANIETISASEFEAKCIDILDRLASGELERVVVTKGGRAVAALIRPDDATANVCRIHGFMRGSVVIPSDLDLTAPALDESDLREL
jgi:antitoxin (DNA-binding transcriptional repressor) of toxin-antitoxin stability system